jgi:hypothetical protein
MRYVLIAVCAIVVFYVTAVVSALVIGIDSTFTIAAAGLIASIAGTGVICFGLRKELFRR